MLIGVYWGYVALMEGLTARMRAEIGRPAKVVATGGLAILFPTSKPSCSITSTTI